MKHSGEEMPAMSPMRRSLELETSWESPTMERGKVVEKLVETVDINLATVSFNLGESQLNMEN